MKPSKNNREPLWVALTELKQIELTRDLLGYIINSFPTHDEERMKEFEQWPEFMSYPVELLAGDLEETNYERVKEAGQFLADQKIILHDNAKKKHFDQVSLLSRFVYHKGKITMWVDGALVPHFADLNKYAVYNFQNFLALSGYHAKQFLEMVAGYANRQKPEFEYTFDDLKEHMGLSGKHPDFKDFKKRMLKPILQQINQKTEFNVSYEAIRGYVHTPTVLQFKVTRSDADNKNPDQLVMNFPERETPETVELNSKQSHWYDFMIKTGFSQQQALNCVLDEKTLALHYKHYENHGGDLNTGNLDRIAYRGKFFAQLKYNNLKI